MGVKTHMFRMERSIKCCTGERSNYKCVNLIYRMKISKLEMYIQFSFIFIIMIFP